MTQPRAATPADAKAVWDSFEKAGKKPSYRLVAEALAASGEYLAVDKKTIQRWHKRNWQPPKKYQPSLEAAVPALTGDATMRVDDLVGNARAPEGQGTQPGPTGQAPTDADPPTPLQVRARAIRAELVDLSDDKLLKRAARQGYITATILLQLVEENPDMLQSAPRELGSLQAALAGSLASSTDTFRALLDLSDRLMKTVDGTATPVEAPEEDPFEDVMAAIRQQAHAA